MATPATAPPPASNLRRIVAASLIGTTIEWYDNSSAQNYDLWFFLIGGREVSTEPAPELNGAGWPVNKSLTRSEKDELRPAEVTDCSQFPDFAGTLALIDEFFGSGLTASERHDGVRRSIDDLIDVARLPRLPPISELPTQDIGLLQFSLQSRRSGPIGGRIEGAQYSGEISTTRAARARSTSSVWTNMAIKVPAATRGSQFLGEGTVVEGECRFHRSIAVAYSFRSGTQSRPCEGESGRRNPGLRDDLQ
ncbi:hypothetical protein ACIBM4_22400 [Streptomyces sp. NPDC050256]|uniref:hypothetical protein n=1 Tax=Streptomyces sp. NPDC050256 TaxID=3365607 RepID=UPI00379E2969